MNLENNKAIDATMSQVLQEIMQLDFLNDYCLVGGTNLALRYQHRKSVDLDLFTYSSDFNLDKNLLLSNKLHAIFKDRINFQNRTEVGLFGYIDNIKVDFVIYPFSFLNPIENYNGIRLASELDIASMKIKAIIGRGSKKDFYDLHELLKKFDFKEIIEAFQKKHFSYDSDTQMIKRSLLYFEDAENKEDRNNYVESFLRETWQDIKDNIEQIYYQYEKQNKKGRRL